MIVTTDYIVTKTEYVLYITQYFRVKELTIINLRDQWISSALKLPLRVEGYCDIDVSVLRTRLRPFLEAGLSISFFECFIFEIRVLDISFWSISFSSFRYFVLECFSLEVWIFLF